MFGSSAYATIPYAGTLATETVVVVRVYPYSERASPYTPKENGGPYTPKGQIYTPFPPQS